jgi:hypothetical protein
LALGSSASCGNIAYRLQSPGGAARKQPSDSALGTRWTSRSHRHRELIRSRASQNTELFEYPRIERILCSSPLQDVFELRPQDPINLHHLHDRRLPITPYERVAEFTKYSQYRPAVNVCISPIKIAQRLADSMALRLAYDPRMVRTSRSLQCHREPATVNVNSDCFFLKTLILSPRDGLTSEEPACTLWSGH